MKTNNKTRLCAIIAVSLFAFSALMVSGMSTDTWKETPDSTAPPVEVMYDSSVESLPTESSQMVSVVPVKSKEAPTDPVPQSNPLPIVSPPFPIDDYPIHDLGDFDDTVYLPDIEINWFKAYDTQLHVIINNIGEEDVTSTFVVAICVGPTDKESGEDWQFRLVYGLDAGERKGIAFDNTYEPGIYGVGVYVDHADDVTESNEGNNVEYHTFEISSPEITFEDHSLSINERCPIIPPPDPLPIDEK